ncbi:type II secretion system protein, partial [bacterium]|nr:type II secretion system protein [bacterium]
TSLNTLAPCGRGQGEGSKSLHKTLSRICKFAYCSLTNSTLSQRERVRSRVDFSLPEKLAFTLAEVLITLGIIGVVAAMTLPAVIGNYQKQQTVSKVKKAYTMLNQALRLSEVDNGEYEYWDSFYKKGNDGALKYIEKYWLPYFKVVKICNTYQECGYSKLAPFKYLNGQPSTMTFTAPSLRVPFITSDGILYAFFVAKGHTSSDGTISSIAAGDIYIDINGSKGPNQYGKDVFFFEVSNHKITANESKTSDCLRTGIGWTCAAKIMMDGWQIKDDYPW